MTATSPRCALSRCGSTDEVRLFLVGLRCRSCTPSALAGLPEPVVPPRIPRPVRTQAPSDAAMKGAEWGPCASCSTRCRRYGVGGNPLCPGCRGGREQVAA